MKRLLAALLAMLLLTGCSVRIDQPDPTVAPASQAEEVRQREALRAAALVESDDAALAADAAAQLAALGGVWQAWPDGDGPSAATASPTADITASDDPLQVLATTTPDLAAAAITASDSSAALLYASIYSARTARYIERGGTVDAAWPATLSTTSSDLIRALDAAAWVLDVYAAQGVVDSQEADTLREWAERGAVSAQLAGTADDPREATYSITPLPELSEIWGQLAAEFVAAVPQSSDRETMLQAVAAATQRAVAAGYSVGALPAIASN